MFKLSIPIYWLYEKKLWRQIKDSTKPRHVAIIMDGNRRYAKKLKLNSSQGHEIGAQHLREVLKWVYDVDIKVLTLYAFSNENFKRSEEEVNKLMDLFRQNFLALISEPLIHEYQINVRAIGRKSSLPSDVLDAIQKAEEATKDYNKRTLLIAIGYGGRMEMIDAVRNLVSDVLAKKAALSDITEEYFEKYLYTSGAPDPDLVIRTSGEERLSGFLLWQSAYSELYFIDTFFPAFRKIDLWRAIRTFQSRERRYGK